MARGWESKAVEAQIETSEGGNQDSDKEHLRPQEVELLRKRDGLLLSRTRVLHDLESSRNPRYRKILQEALDYLDHELAQIAAVRETS
jgi:hypothetical protein